MQVAVELFGIARSRAGVARAVARGALLGDVLEDLVRQYPELGETCIDGQRLRAGFIVNVCGNQFVSAPETALAPGDTVMLLSMDAGG
jgi:molybdopterin converting factor small subunit